MLLFDSDLLCVDGLIDADSLGREEGKEGQRRAEERKGEHKSVSRYFHSKYRKIFEESFT